MTSRSIAALVLAAALAVPAAAALSPKYAHWADGPEGFLLTSAERTRWAAIDNDDAAVAFIALFWARRDPNLATLRNEAFDRFVERVRYADQHFGTEHQRGALTDRGRLLIVLGVPYRVETRGPSKVVEHIGANTWGTDQTWGEAELWEYLPAELPVPVKGTQVVFVLYENHRGSNDFVIDRTHPRAARALSVLERAPAVLVRNPNLQRLPLPRTLTQQGSGGDPAGRAP